MVSFFLSVCHVAVGNGAPASGWQPALRIFGLLVRYVARETQVSRAVIDQGFLDMTFAARGRALAALVGVGGAQIAGKAICAEGAVGGRNAVAAFGTAGRHRWFLVLRIGRSISRGRPFITRRLACFNGVIRSQGKGGNKRVGCTPNLGAHRGQ
jgi:hypothetical protein